MIEAGRSTRYTLGVDVGTSSSKGVLVDETGVIAATSTITHGVRRPRPGWVEMDGRVWWEEFLLITRDLISQHPDGEVTAVGVSGMGPCVLLADDADSAVRPAILYGIDTRAHEQIRTMRATLGDSAITTVGGSRLTSQAAGPKIAWTADEEPESYARARRLYMPASFLVRNLTGEYILDHGSASQVSPLYDVQKHAWHANWWGQYARGINPPRLCWSDEIVGTITARAAKVTGLREGTPVTAGAIDAWAEAISVGAEDDGDLMLMYGTTMFLIATGRDVLRSPSMWTTVGTSAGICSLAGGLATSGALTAWVKGLTGTDYPTLLTEADAAGAGAHGLLMLPYFAGERTPIQDPDARGVIAGLTLTHTRGDLYRAALEATAFGVRHNVDTMRTAGADIRRIAAAGGGIRGRLWPQIVSDVTGLRQEIHRTTIGASYGSAFLAARATAELGQEPRIDQWNPPVDAITPDPAVTARYDTLFDRYLRLYTQTADIAHELAHDQKITASKESL